MDEVIYFVNIIDIYNILLLWSCITLGCPIGLPVLATYSVVTMSSSEPSQNHPHKSIFSGVFFGVHVILLLIDIHSCFPPMQLHVPVQSYKNRRERANDLIPPLSVWQITRPNPFHRRLLLDNAIMDTGCHEFLGFSSTVRRLTLSKALRITTSVNHSVRQT